jgi:hypothetical protein
MTETTSNKDTLAAALARAQAAMGNVTKDSANPHFRSRFASLAAVRDVVVPALAAQGIAVVQMPGNDEQGRVTVRTLLLHSAGELDCGTVATSATVRGGNEAQAVGSALSYLRRYALASIAGVAQEDDDGNASGPARQPRRAPAAPAPMHLALQAARDKLRAVFGDDVDDARKMVRESTGLDIREALADVDACKTILAALAKG